MTHPLTPTPELVQQWMGDYYGCPVSGELAGVETAIATRAAQWGADTELEACCRELAEYCDCGVELTSGSVRELLMELRRPRPPSLKEQALETLKYPKDLWSEAEVDTIRRALEQLDDQPTTPHHPTAGDAPAMGN
jgi:hypothetical protein